jgi:hypothetical protein
LYRQVNNSFLQETIALVRKGEKKKTKKKTTTGEVFFFFSFLFFFVAEKGPDDVSRL